MGDILYNAACIYRYILRFSSARAVFRLWIRLLLLLFLLLLLPLFGCARDRLLLWLLVWLRR